VWPSGLRSSEPDVPQLGSLRVSEDGSHDPIRLSVVGCNPEIMSEDKDIFENVYRQPGAGWTIPEPPAELVELVERREIGPCKAIDIGCGEGFYSIYLASKGFDVLGIDLSEKAIQYAKENAERHETTVRFAAMDMTSLEQLNEKFDFVLEWSVLHHIMPPQRQKYVEGVAQLLHHGGKYLSVCFNEQSPEVTRDGEKYRISPVGTKLYYSSESELRELFAPYFRIMSTDITTIFGRHGQAHTVNYFFMEKP